MAKKSHQEGVQLQENVQLMSQFQVLAARLLELTSVELEDRVRAELHENPALDEDLHRQSEQELPSEGEGGDDVRANYRSEDDVPDYEWQRSGRHYAQIEEIPFSEATSFFEMLQEQLDERHLTPHQRRVATYLLGSLDDDGLLRKDLLTIYDELQFHMDIVSSVEELEQLLKMIQSFDPAGVGATNLQECLLLQLERKERTQGSSELLTLEKRIVKHHYKDFTNKQWARIEQRVEATPEMFQQAIAEICRLNPRPGASMGESIGRSGGQIVPDFIVDTTDDEEITIALNNRNVPELHLNNEFVQLLEEEEEREADDEQPQETTSFLKQKVMAAQTFVGALKLRHQTMLKTMGVIVAKQRPFFLEGDFALLKPMTRVDVAKELGMDVSTISRVCNGKYAQTRFGIFALKDFFTDAYTADEKKDLTVVKMMQELKKLIDTEDKTKPYTDDELSELLKKQGLSMARRTIAKYREQLGIPVARLRSELL